MYAMLVADDLDEKSILSLILQRAGLAVTTGKDLDVSIRSWSERPADLLLLALHEKQDPMSYVRRVRAEISALLILVVDPLPEGMLADLLEKGADMIVTRPFGVRLFIAQIRALLRRAGGIPIFSIPTLSIAGLTLDPSTRTVRVGTQAPKRLTHLEFRLLYTLMINRGQVLPVDVIVEHVWEYTDTGSRDLVRGLISRLRNKIEEDPRAPRYILTVPGVGYTFSQQEG